ncbi:MAG: hypothetical protein WC380_00120 [Pedobacter sp.]|jgi:hypothetical protein
MTQRTEIDTQLSKAQRVPQDSNELFEQIKINSLSELDRIKRESYVEKLKKHIEYQNGLIKVVMPNFSKDSQDLLQRAINEGKELIEEGR